VKEVQNHLRIKRETGGSHSHGEHEQHGAGTKARGAGASTKK
jgi:hypothetical protein